MTMIHRFNVSLLACLLLSFNRHVTVVRVVEAFSAVAPPPKTASSAFSEADDNDKKQLTPQGPFKPWPSPVIVCHGDYREQASLEEHIAGPLYAQQKNMPRLPIPDLEETIQRFLPTAVPLVENAEEMQSLEQACRDFPQQAQILQERLLQRQQQDFKDSSWLQEMWQTAGYLQVRDPVAVLISYYLLVPHDETLDVKGNKSSQQQQHAGIARGAAMLTAMAESRKQICSGNMPAESIPRKDGNDDYLCSTGFKYMFHACRVPQAKQDVYHIYDPALYKHCIVASRGQFYAMVFCNEQGDPLPLAVLEQRLEQCVELSKHHQQQEFPQLGWLTSCNRDVWAQAREELINIGKGPMEEALAKMESGAFVLNLDDEEPETLTEDGKIFWHGGHNGGGANRWYDKAIQLLCTKNGHVAYMGEHSMLDAAPAIPLIRRILKTTHKRLRQKQEKAGETAASELDDDNNPGVINVFEKCWTSKPLMETANKLTAVAKEHHEELTGDYELKVLLFTKFGKKYLKQAGLGPEFVQMAMQLAAYRLLGQQVATYEAALARAFLHGRTETARPVSLESNAFVQCMGKKPYEGDRDKKLDLLKKAAAVHEERQGMASKGLGVDRHLFGLSMMVQDDDEKPSLFSHPVFRRSKHWRLSTSAVIFSPGFGPVVDDGMGIGFQVASDSCLFTCTSLKANQYVEPFCDLLEEALNEMGDLVKPDE